MSFLWKFCVKVKSSTFSKQLPLFSPIPSFLEKIFYTHIYCQIPSFYKGGAGDSNYGILKAKNCLGKNFHMQPQKNMLGLNICQWPKQINSFGQVELFDNPSTANIDLFKVNNKNTRKKMWSMFQVNDKDIITTSITSF